MSRMWKDPVFGTLARGLYERCGLVFEGGQAHLFRKRVERRAVSLGYPDVAAYIAAIDGRGDVEYERMIELLTVNETYFFREEEHFQLLLDRFWGAWRRAGTGPIRVWSAACSTGCEPYTLAMMLREKGLVAPWEPGVEILGTDVNPGVLDRAREGLFGEFALRGTAGYFRDKYFRREGEMFRLVPEVRSMVTFRRHNLLSGGVGPGGGGFHAILCRNVLIYFDLEAKRRVVGALTRVLASEGVLLVGRSESLFNVPEAPPMETLDGLIVYRRPRSPEERTGPRKEEG